MNGTNVGSIEYYATINTSGLKKDAYDTERIVGNTGDTVEKTGKSSFAAFGQWARIGLAAASVATVALGVSIFKTGIEYNTLQQTSRAALKTILGGAEAANAQMDKLDAFARTSPFAKDVFLKAQQQLLGFGVQADKVIPALSAIQNAVAAVGGSSADIGQITDVLAKIQAQGKLSGEELLQLGGYGIDAASIIGKGMGKTGQEIREMASQPGGISVDKIWDPLVNGLEEKFGGAADGVKSTWAGTVDRITAAFRDVGAAIAAPFVDPSGGGAAITWGNELANSLGAFKAMVGPTMETIKNAIKIVVEALKPVTDFIRNNTTAWEVLKITLAAIVVIIGALVVGLGVTLVAAFAIVAGAIWLAVKAVEYIIETIMWLGNALAGAIYSAAQFATSLISSFLTAVNTIKSIFGSLGGFFQEVWNSIVGMFTNVGTAVGNAIGNTFKSVINSVLSGAVNLINGFINAINVAVDTINKIPGVKIGKLGTLPIPQLAAGGIVSSPTLAMIGEGRESEAVIPLSKLDAMINSDRNNSTSGGDIKIELNMSGIMTRSKSDMRVVAGDLIESINEQLRARQLPEIGGGNLRKGIA